MQEHFGYWQALLEQGTAVVYGPVADPAGTRGPAAVDTVFAWALPVAALAFLLSLLLPGRPFRDSLDGPRIVPGPGDESPQRA